MPSLRLHFRMKYYTLTNYSTCYLRYTTISINITDKRYIQNHRQYKLVCSTNLFTDSSFKAVKHLLSQVVLLRLQTS